MNPTNLECQGFVSIREMLHTRIPAAWKKPCEPNEPDTWPRIDFTQRDFMTAGQAVSSRENFKLIGRWGLKARNIEVHDPGLKRILIPERPELYYSTGEREADRCHSLVDTLPAPPPHVLDTFNTPSKPHKPKWLESETVEVENEWESEADLETGMTILGL
jgi:hypothetical protein